MEMTRMKISNHKPIIYLLGVFSLVFTAFLFIDALKDKSNKMLDVESSVKAFDSNSGPSKSGLLHNSVSVHSVSTGVSHEVVDEEYF